MTRVSRLEKTFISPTPVRSVRSAKRQASKGRTFEEALEYWSPTGAYGDMRYDPTGTFRIKANASHSASSWHGNPVKRERLEDYLFDRPRAGELLSIALRTRDDPSEKRFVVTPQTFVSPWLTHYPSKNVIRGEGF